VFQFSDKRAPHQMDPLDLHSQSQGTTERVPLLGYALKNRSSRRVVTGKWLLKN